VFFRGSEFQNFYICLSHDIARKPCDVKVGKHRACELLTVICSEDKYGLSMLRCLSRTKTPWSQVAAASVLLHFDNIVASLEAEHTCIHTLLGENIRLSTILNECIKG